MLSRLAHIPALSLCLIACMLIISACTEQRAPQPSAPVAADPTVQPHPYDRPVAIPAPTPPAPPSGVTIPVGLLLPLSGDEQELGKAILDAAMLGLFDTYESTNIASTAPRIMLMPKDTEGLADQAETAAKAAISDGATLLLGPVFSDENRAAMAVARRKNIPIIGLSNNGDIAGDGAYIFGFMPQQQVRRIMDEAHFNGKDRIAALLPDTAYGALMKTALTEAAALNGQTLVRIIDYPEGTQDFSDMISALMRDENGARATPTLDGLFIVETGEPLDHMLTTLNQSRLKEQNITLLGTGLWDDHSMYGNPNMIGAWFASAPLRSYEQFVQRFEHAYGYTPPRLASLGYDAASLAVNLAASGQINDAALQNRRGFAGAANGIFRFKPDGTIDRGLSVLTYTRNGKREQSSAPRAFYD